MSEETKHVRTARQERAAAFWQRSVEDGRQLRRTEAAIRAVESTRHPQREAQRRLEL
jgi:hypothetical protein